MPCGRYMDNHWGLWNVITITIVIIDYGMTVPLNTASWIWSVPETTKRVPSHVLSMVFETVLERVKSWEIKLAEKVD